MRSNTSEGHVGHSHDAGFYDGDDEFRAVIVPFVEEGVEASEPVILGYDHRKSELLRGWLRDPSAVTFLSNTTLYSTPARTIAHYRRLFARHVATGAAQIRVAGDVPYAGDGERFVGWDRYESAVNTVWRDYPVHSVCLYDAATVAPRVRDVVERTHPCLLTPVGQRRANPCYEDPDHFVGLPAAADSLEDTPPAIDLHDPTPAEARDAVRGLAAGRLGDEIIYDLVLAVHEATTNAQVHGRPPTRIQVWVNANRVVVHVHDHGPGPRNPLAGLVPVHSETSAGLGMWLTHQLDLDVAFLRTAEGFTVRLRAGHIPERDHPTDTL